ncbi:MAG: hypothetical protein WDN00_17020 [Limisphaerales bacterium]
MGARGTSYGTHHVTAYARRESSRAHRHPPGCNRVDDSSLAAFLKAAKLDKWRDTSGASADRLKYFYSTRSFNGWIG